MKERQKEKIKRSMKENRKDKKEIQIKREMNKGNKE